MNRRKKGVVGFCNVRADSARPRAYFNIKSRNKNDNKILGVFFFPVRISQPRQWGVMRGERSRPCGRIDVCVSEVDFCRY